MNNYIFYVTKCGSTTKFNSLEKWYKIIQNVEGSREYWQGRFNDTLAWYNYRKALLAKKSDQLQVYASYLEEASDWVEKALKELKTPREKRESEKLRRYIKERQRIWK